MNNLQKTIAMSILTLIPSCASYRCTTLGGIIPEEEKGIREKVNQIMPAFMDSSEVYFKFSEEGVYPKIEKGVSYRGVMWKFMETE